MAVYPARMAPIGLKLGQTAFQVIPDILFFDVKNRKIFAVFGLDHVCPGQDTCILARTHVSWLRHMCVSWPGQILCPGQEPGHMCPGQDTCVLARAQICPGHPLHMYGIPFKIPYTDKGPGPSPDTPTGLPLVRQEPLQRLQVPE